VAGFHPQNDTFPFGCHLLQLTVYTLGAQPAVVAVLEVFDESLEMFFVPGRLSNT